MIFELSMYELFSNPLTLANLDTLCITLAVLQHLIQNEPAISFQYFDLILNSLKDLVLVLLLNLKRQNIRIINMKLVLAWNRTQITIKVSCYWTKI